MIPEKAKLTYYALLKEDTNTAKVLARTVEVTDGVSLSEGWALKSARFNDAQKKHLEDKFNLKQETRHKQDPERVANDMRLQQKQMGRGCSQATSSSPHNRYSRSFQEWHLTSVKLRG